MLSDHHLEVPPEMLRVQHTLGSSPTAGMGFFNDVRERKTCFTAVMR
jgi:hypothetical protein